MIEHLIQIHKDLGGLDSPIIHIAGSKGKGTTAILLAKILELCGKKVGLFTSPALFGPEEMIMINGAQINVDLLAKERFELLEKHKDLSDFEVFTLCALKYFQDEKCDYVILECGWGGKKDATNIVENKQLTILAHVELEHTEVLGRSLAEIAHEKLGICRKDVPLVTLANQVKEVFDEVGRRKLTAVIAPMQEIGHHHPECVGLALTAAEKLGFTVSPQIYSSLEALVIPGRFEVLKWDKHTIVLDGAHTFDSIYYLEEKVLNYVREEGLPKPFFGIHFLSDKPSELYKLFPRSKTIWIKIDHPRASEAPEDLPSFSVEEAFEELKNEEYPRLFVFVGSFRLVAAVKEYLRDVS